MSRFSSRRSAMLLERCLQSIRHCDHLGHLITGDHLHSSAKVWPMPRAVKAKHKRSLAAVGRHALISARTWKNLDANHPPTPPPPLSHATPLSGRASIGNGLRITPSSYVTSMIVTSGSSPRPRALTDA